MRSFIIHIKKHGSLYGILFLSFCLRLLFSLDNNKALFVDIKSYDAYAVNIMNKGYFSISAYHPPLYPSFLALVYRIFQHDFIPVYLVQCVLGTANTFLIYRIARNIGGEKLGVVSAAASLLYWPLTLYSGVLLAETLFLFVMLTGVHMYLRGFENHKWTCFAACGLFMGLSTLTRSITLLLLFILPVVYIFFARNREKRVRIRNSLLYAVVFCLVLSPWVLRNYRLYHKFIPVDTLGGVNLYIGNNDRANGFFVDITSDPLNDAGDNDYENDRILKQAAVRYILSNPVKTVALTLWRAVLFIGFDIGELDWVIARYMKENFIFGLPLLKYIFQVSNIAFFIMALYGMSIFLKSKKGLLLLGFVLYFFGLTSLFYIQSRYRLPVMPFMAIACASTLDRIKARRMGTPG